MNKRDKILDTMLDLVVEEGFQAATISAVSKRAEVAVGTIYHHFKTKEDIFKMLYLRIKNEIAEEAIRHLDPSLTHKENFFLIWSDLHDYLIDNPHKFKYSEQFAFSLELPESIKAKGESYFKTLKDFFEKGMKEGILKEMNLELLVGLAFSSLVCFVNHQIMSGSRMDDACIGETINVAWDSIAKKTADNK